MIALIIASLEIAFGKLITLVTFHMRGILAWSIGGWQIFAAANSHLQGIAFDH